MQIAYIASAIAFAVGFLFALVIYLIKRNSAFRAVSQATEIAESIKRDAAKEAEVAKKAALVEAREEWFKQKRIFDEEVKERQRELRAQEKKYNERLGSLDKRLDSLDKKENNLTEQEQRLKGKEDELQQKKQEFDDIITEQKRKLAEVAGLSREEALERLRLELIHCTSGGCQ